MLHLIRMITRRFRLWERPVQIALLAAFGLLLIVSLVIAAGPGELRQAAVIGFGGLLIVAQLIIMWATRDMVTPYTQAQRHYLAGDFDAAHAVLEPLHAAGSADARDLTLLGNLYRQLGRLDESERVLLEALDKAPNHYFPLYGLGRTLMAEGRYAEAAVILRRALAAGAPPGVSADLGEALYRDGQPDDARAALQAVGEDSDTGRALMTAYLRYRLDEDRPADTMLETGLPYWQAQAERFRRTTYGRALAADIDIMQTLLKESRQHGTPQQ